MNTLNITEVIKWLRAKAAELNKTADSLEQIMGSRSFMRGVSPELERKEIGLEDVVKILRRKGAGRAQDFARELRTDKELISEIIRDNPETFELRERGWIKLNERAALNGGRV